MKALTEIKEKYTENIMKKANVTGIGIGFKETRGKKTDQLSIVVLVEKKLPVTALRKEDVVQEKLDGIPTDVVEVGRFEALDVSTANDRMKKWRPAPGGVSIGHYQITAGTLGVTVIDKKTGEELILSNNHVLADCNEGQIGDAILQPGPFDGGITSDAIAELCRFVPLEFSLVIPTSEIAVKSAGINSIFTGSGPHHRMLPVRTSEKENTVDAAVALPERRCIVDDKILEIGVLEGILQAELDMAVEKSGRTTGHTTGIVKTMDVTVTVYYGDLISALFSHQILADIVSKSGDSGSVVVSEKSAVGLLFAGSDRFSLLNPIDLVLDALNVEL